MQKPVIVFALAALAVLAWLAFDARGGLDGSGLSHVAAVAVGGLAGIALYHASFGFTAAWRRLVRERRGAGLRAQIVLILLTCAISYPLIVWGAEIGLPARGFILPMGVASAIGAFTFGVGMQLGGGCASGTLFTVGGGSTRMVIVLAFFIAGSVIATAHWDFWRAMPRMGGVSLTKELGVMGALGAMAAVFGAIWAFTVWLERRAHGSLEAPRPTGPILTGPWSLILGAVALAVVGIGTFLALGRPWGVTSGFALWGAQILDAAGVPVREWTYWQPEWRQNQIANGPFSDGTSLMNFAIILGAMTAAALAGKWSPSLKLSRRDLLTAVIGGLLMGYGARLAYGCNIGAYLGGMVSGSLHGWWWLIWGFAGSILGTRLRGWLEMDPPLAPRQAAI